MGPKPKKKKGGWHLTSSWLLKQSGPKFELYLKQKNSTQILSLLCIDRINSTTDRIYVLNFFDLGSRSSRRILVKPLEEES